MPANIFLTGDIRSGKTTIIKKTITELGLDPGGFMVGRKEKEGHWTEFFLVDARDFISAQKQGKKKINPKGEAVFARRDNPGSSVKIYPGAFDGIGVELIDRGLRERQIIIMDELGRFELEAVKFQNKVEEVLAAAKPVLGVIKKEKNPFLDRIRRREDVLMFEVDADNRDILCRIIMEKTRLFVDFL